ncbi:MAG: hypothetical protein LBU43_09105 [Candidatus Accumulibacter sp.]|jgi:hypothetical protein|nr:hypothetical protein [Accumulibacter sp.]
MKKSTLLKLIEIDPNIVTVGSLHGDLVGIYRSVGCVRKGDLVIGCVYRKDQETDPEVVGIITDYAEELGLSIDRDALSMALPLSPFERAPKSMKALCAKHGIDFAKLRAEMRR